MELILYNLYEPKNKVNKNPREIIKLNGTLREATSLINPVIVIELNTQEISKNLYNYIKTKDNDNLVDSNQEKIVFKIIKEILDANYAYINLFNRYYFIENITSLKNNLWAISMHVDVLMSYKNDILNSEAFISRNENTFNKGINDREATTLTYPKISTYEIENDLFEDLPFSTGHSNLKYVLTLIQNERSE